MLVTNASKRTRRENDSEAARRLFAYRKKPSLWVKHHIDIELARYRDRTELETWLDQQPEDSHTWCRDMLARDALALDSKRSYQEEMLDAMAEPGWYAWQAANGVGKTGEAALVLLWFMDCYPDCRVVTTAGTFSQLKEQLWREIPAWASRAKMSIVVHQKNIQKTKIEVDDNWAAFGRAASGEATFEGPHAKYVLILVDEAKAVRSDIAGAIRRIMRGHPDGLYWVVLLSTPGSPDGMFFDYTAGDLVERCTTYKISAYESSRIPLQTIADDWRDLGDLSPLFISMNCAEYPEEGDDTVVPLKWAQAAIERDVDDDGSRVLAIDPARYGPNETVFFEFAGRRGRVVDAYHGRNTMNTVGRIKNLSPAYDSVAIDSAGMGGPIYDALIEENVEVAGLNAGSASSDPRYLNLGTEMAFAVRRDLEETYRSVTSKKGNDPSVGLSLPNDKLLIHQLTARKYRYRRDGKIALETKEAMADRLKSADGGGSKSPDRADGCNMANWIRGGAWVPVAAYSGTEDIERARREAGLDPIGGSEPYKAQRPNAFGRING